MSFKVVGSGRRSWIVYYFNVGCGADQVLRILWVGSEAVVNINVNILLIEREEMVKPSCIKKAEFYIVTNFAHIIRQ